MEGVAVVGEVVVIAAAVVVARYRVAEVPTG